MTLHREIEGECVVILTMKGGDAEGRFNLRGGDPNQMCTTKRPAGALTPNRPDQKNIQV